MPGLIGEKIGMTQVFTQNGTWVPVTVLKAGPCQVILKKTSEKDGYGAIQLGFQEIDAKRRNKALGGHYLKKNLKVCKVLKEIRTSHADSYTPGDILTVGNFQEGDVVDTVGTSKGKGFQGVMKRHHFKGGRATHGCSVSHRAPGSIGQRTFPGKVFKGKRMAGRMGGDTVTVKNLKVIGIELEQNIILIRGSIPGANHSIIEIHPTSGDFEKRFIEKKTKSTEPKVEQKATQTEGNEQPTA